MVNQANKLSVNDINKLLEESSTATSVNIHKHTTHTHPPPQRHYRSSSISFHVYHLLPGSMSDNLKKNFKEIKQHNQNETLVRNCIRKTSQERILIHPITQPQRENIPFNSMPWRSEKTRDKE